MKTRWILDCLMMAMCMLVTHAIADDGLGAYATKIPLRTVPDASLQRVVLPAAIFASMQTANYADLRVFNDEGKSVPMAMITPSVSLQSKQAMQTFIAYPMMGEADRVLDSTTSLRIEELAGQHVVRIDSSVASNQATLRVIGALIDTRALKNELVDIHFDAEILHDQVVPVSIEASPDLKTWRSLVYATPLYQFSGANAPMQMTIELASGVLLNSEYLRVTWPAAQKVMLRGVDIRTITGRDATLANQTLSLGNPATADAHTLIWRVPFASPIDRVELKASNPNSLIPIRVLGRVQHGEPWRLLANTVLYRLTTAGKESFSPAVLLNGASVRELKIEADQSSLSFDQQTIEAKVSFTPVQIAFLASGRPPFTLAAGQANAVNGALPLASLIPNYQAGDAFALPEAKADTVEKFNLGTQVEPDVSQRSIILWAILIAGVLVLGGIAWAVMRQLNVKK